LLVKAEKKIKGINMKYVGIDLHSNRFNICIIEDGVEKNQRKTYLLNEDDIEKFIDNINRKDTYIMVEASTNSFCFTEKIEKYAKEIYIANTHKLKLISMVKKKTDKIDAEKLAMFLKMQIMSKEELISPVYRPEKKIQELRSLFVTHKLYRKNIATLKNRIHSIFKQNLMPFTKEYIFGKKFQKDLMELPLIDSYKFQIELLLNQMNSLIDADKKLKETIIKESYQYRKEIDVMTSMKGISVITAIAIISDIGEIRRFQTSKKLSSYLRSAPSVDSSNESIRIGRTNKFGRKLSLTMLMQSMNHFRDNNPKLKSFYARKEPFKNKKVIRVAMGRRVITELYQMLKTERYHLYREEELHVKKMSDYYKKFGGIYEINVKAA
jgi:transposase